MNLVKITAMLGGASFQGLTLHSLWFVAGFSIGAAAYKYYYLSTYVWF